MNGTSEERLLAQLTALQLAVSQGATNTVIMVHVDHDVHVHVVHQHGDDVHVDHDGDDCEGRQHHAVVEIAFLTPFAFAAIIIRPLKLPLKVLT